MQHAAFGNSVYSMWPYCGGTSKLGNVSYGEQLHHEDCGFKVHDRGRDVLSAIMNLETTILTLTRIL